MTKDEAIDIIMGFVKDMKTPDSNLDKETVTFEEANEKLKSKDGQSVVAAMRAFDCETEPSICSHCDHRYECRYIDFEADTADCGEPRIIKSCNFYKHFC